MFYSKLYFLVNLTNHKALLTERIFPEVFKVEQGSLIQE